LAKPWKSPLRLYLTGRLTAELGDRGFDERTVPGRQGRRALVYLALERARPVPIDEVADAVWGTATPSGAWETALSAIVSKLRASLRGLDAHCTVTTAAGCYQLALPENVAASVGGRPLLGGIDADWITRTRTMLRDTRVRALECLAATASANAEHALAAQLARDVVQLEPFRETGWQRLMRALAAAGNRAEAVRAYGQCKKLLADELGIAPSRETEAMLKELRARG
jgi:DNA-binding SARP family transcriptional activator